MNKKIVFFDIDGTILDHQGQIPNSTKKAIWELQDNGVYTAIATGRNPNSFQWICEELNIDTYVAINGSYVVFEGKPLYLRNIPDQELEKIVETVKSYNHSMGFVTHKDMWVMDEDHPLIKQSFDFFDIPYPRVEKELHLTTPICQVMIYCEKSYEKMYRENHPNVDFVRFHEIGMDAMTKGTSKAVGIEKILQAGGFKLNNAYAFGDGLNDVEMISMVGSGIAMGNAVPMLKEVADFVTTSSSENGILKGLKIAGLIKAKVG